MSIRADTSSLVPGCIVASLYPGHGITGAAMRLAIAAGEGGAAGPLLDDIRIGDDFREFRWQVVGRPNVGTLRTYEDGSVDFTDAPDGVYTFYYRLDADGVQDLVLGTFTVFIGQDDVELEPAYSMVDLDAWADFVQPLVPYCPDVTIRHYVRQALIEFCQTTLVWQYLLPPVVAQAMVRSYRFPLPADTAMVKLIGFTVNDQEADVVTPDRGRRLALDGSSLDAAWTQDRVNFTINPRPTVDGAQYRFNAALKPAQTAASVAQVLFEQYAREITDGALAGLFDMANVSWSDPVKAVARRTKFEASMDRISAQVSKGFSRAARSVKALHF